VNCQPPRQSTPSGVLTSMKPTDRAAAQAVLRRSDLGPPVADDNAVSHPETPDQSTGGNRLNVDHCCCETVQGLREVLRDQTWWTQQRDIRLLGRPAALGVPADNELGVSPEQHGAVNGDAAEAASVSRHGQKRNSSAGSMHGPAPDREHLLALLTPRERDVLALMAEGASNPGIANELQLSARAAEKYVSRVFTKLALPSGTHTSRRVRAVLMYLGR
jgi:DNA-binding CsgD family transcriptional regulator